MNQTEEWALIDFINAREPGNMLREIAERRLVDLRNRCTDVPKKFRTAREVENTLTGEIFPTILEAARSQRIPYTNLTYDLRQNKRLYPFRYYEKITIHQTA